MSIKQITTDQLLQMEDQEGLVLQGCGGDLQDWQDGINGLLTSVGILRSGTKFENIGVFDREGRTCILFPFTQDIDLDMGKLAIWRLKSQDQFEGMWLSDYVDIKLGGYTQQQANNVAEAFEMSIPATMNGLPAMLPQSQMNAALTTASKYQDLIQTTRRLQEAKDELDERWDEVGDRISELWCDSSCFLFKPREWIAEQYGEEIADIWTGIEIDDPYALCFAFLYSHTTTSRESWYSEDMIPGPERSSPGCRMCGSWIRIWYPMRS